MTTNKQLRELARGTVHWSGSLAHVWPSDPDFNDAWAVGTIDEDGNKYPAIEVDADQYDAAGDSERLARFFTAANPATVLSLLDENEALQAECEKLRSSLSQVKDLIGPYLYGGSNFREPASQAIALITAAMQGDQP